MAFPRVKSCCCRLSLESGTRLIANLGIYLSIVGIFATYYAAQYVLSMKRETMEGRIAGQLITIGLSALLLQGCDRRKPFLILAWLIVEGIGLGLALFAVPFYMVVMLIAILDGSSLEAIGIFMMASLILAGFLALVGYCYAVVFSFYRQLKDGSGSSGGGNQV